MQLLMVVFKTVFFYFFILFSYRIMGKREVGQLGIIDLIVSILIAELVAISIDNRNESLLFTVVPIGVLVFLEISLAYLSVKSRKFRSFFDGKPSLIINEGKLNYNEMVKLRYSLDDLLLQLRQNSIKSIDEIEYAFLEPDGKLSIFPYNFMKLKSAYPMPLIVDGVIQYNTLKKVGKTDSWLKSELFDMHLTEKDVFYAFYKKRKIYLIKNSDIK